MEMVLLSVNFLFPVPPFPESMLPLLSFFFFFPPQKTIYLRGFLSIKKMDPSALGLTGKVSYRRQVLIVGTDLSGDW